MVHDYRALETARKDAAEIIDLNLLETKEDYYQLKCYLEENSFIEDKLD